MTEQSDPNGAGESASSTLEEFRAARDRELGEAVFGAERMDMPTESLAGPEDSKGFTDAVEDYLGEHGNIMSGGRRAAMLETSDGHSANVVHGPQNQPGDYTTVFTDYYRESTPEGGLVRDTLAVDTEGVPYVVRVVTEGR